MTGGLKASIREHYDLLSPLYRDLWGIHIHHGYWIDGTETKEQAQEQLIEILASRIGMRRGTRMLDIGCGIGGTAIYLARRFDARVIGITISPVQALMATRLAAMNGIAGCSFAAMDAEEMGIGGEFDVVWSVEALSHMSNRQHVLEDAIALLKPGGKLGIIDWFKHAGLTHDDQTRYLDPLEKGMLVYGLDTMETYAGSVQACDCRVTAREDLTASIAKTWDICTEFSRLPSLWRIARDHGPDFVRFFRSFRAMQAALRAGVFRYGLITAEKL
jgi:tocopherol O-methyltransferase